MTSHATCLRWFAKTQELFQTGDGKIINHTESAVCGTKIERVETRWRL